MDRFLRKENFEALIDGDLRLVGFDLGKIRAQKWRRTPGHP